MELRLIVLAGAKQGTRIPLKKEKFIIGRAKECTLRAGSEAISRRHCAIVRRESGWAVKDLKSRNGTYLNNERIEEETPLKAGDELSVGPLKFRVEVVEPVAPAAEPVQARPAKHPPVKDVAEAAQRSAARSEQTATEDDISRWLLGMSDEPDGDTSLKETRTLSMHETATLAKAKGNQPGSRAAVPVAAADEDAESESAAAESEAEMEEASEEKGSWNWLKLGKAKSKKKPGKLPPRASAEPTKDSREAAADILREMTRRR